MRWAKVLLVAALVSGVAPAIAGGSGRGDATRAERFQAWRAEHARLSRGLPETAASDAIEAAGSYAELMAAGDLDGDGAGDFVDVRGQVSYDDVLGMVQTVRLDAFRGRDGKALWSARVPPATHVMPLVTPVGLDGKPGVLVLAYRDVSAYDDAASGGEYDTTVTPYDRTGVPLWTREVSGAWASTLPGYVEGDTSVVGLFDAVAGGGTDLLLQADLYAGASDPTGTVGKSVSAAQLGILDGATGAIRPLGQPLAGTSDAPEAWAVGDLDKDGLDDVAVDVSTDRESTLTALSSDVAGRVLWTTPNYAPAGFNRLLGLPDVTGDGAADIGVSVSTFRMPIGSGPIPTMQSTVALVDGARGNVLWRRPGTRLIVLGNADRRPGVEIAIGESIGGSFAGFTVAAYTGAGRRLWSVTRKLPFTGDKFSYINSWSALADVDGDGVHDLGYAIAAGSGGKSRRDEGTIDGRTGRVTRDPRPGMSATRAALDGRGADAFLTKSAGGVFTLDAWRGDAPVQLWSVAVGVAGEFRGSIAASVDGDRCDDLAAALESRGTYTDVVYSGSTGTPLWALSRSGEAIATVAKPSVRRHKVYRRGC